MGCLKVYADSDGSQLVKRGLIPLACRRGRVKYNFLKPHHIILELMKIGIFFKLGDDWTYAAA
jgi:hypothetical protein